MNARAVADNKYVVTLVNLAAGVAVAVDVHYLAAVMLVLAVELIDYALARRSARLDSTVAAVTGESLPRFAQRELISTWRLAGVNLTTLAALVLTGHAAPPTTALDVCVFAYILAALSVAVAAVYGRWNATLYTVWSTVVLPWLIILLFTLVGYGVVSRKRF